MSSDGTRVIIGGIYNEMEVILDTRGFELVVGDSAATSMGSARKDIDGEAANDYSGYSVAILGRYSCYHWYSIMMPTEVPLDMRGSLSWLLIVCNIQVGSARKTLTERQLC
jgi:hypothetical protein